MIKSKKSNSSDYLEFLGALLCDGPDPEFAEYERHVQDAWIFWFEGTRVYLPWNSLPVVVYRYHDGDVEAALQLLREKNPKLASKARRMLDRLAESKYFGGIVSDFGLEDEEAEAAATA